MSDDERLWGLRGAEVLYTDAATLYETDIEPHDEGDGPWEVEEWDVHEPSTHFPPPDRVLDTIVEWVAECGEVDEEFADRVENVAVHPEVVAATQALLELIASKTGYRMAKNRIATHTITLVDGEPHLDGEPIYGKES